MSGTSAMVRRPATRRPWSAAVAVGGVSLALVVGVVVAAAPLYALALVVAAALAAAIWARPALAAYLVIGLTPLTAGIDRGRLIPVLRPNEAVVFFVSAVLLGRWLVRLRSGQVKGRWPDDVEWSLLALAVASSFVPLVIMSFRGRAVSADDIQYALVLWKYGMVYLLVRASVRTQAEVRVCLWVSMVSAAVVGLLAILQSLQLFGVPSLLGTLWTLNGNEGALSAGRGSSTLALPAAVADLMIFNLAVAAGFLLRGVGRRLVVGSLAALFAMAALSAGEFSSAIGLLVGLVVVAVVTRRYRMLWGIPALGLVGGIALWPVIATRLEGFQSASGLPVSWTGRLYNLQTYFLPQLSSTSNLLLGVRPAARVPNPHKANGFIWIECGYLWLLWGGGLALLAAYVLFVVVSTRRGLRVARAAPDATGTSGLAVVVAVLSGVVLMIFDPHLTYRGAADLLFALLALTAVGSRPVAADEPAVALPVAAGQASRP